MKHLLGIIVSLLLIVTVNAQEHLKFDLHFPTAGDQLTRQSRSTLDSALATLDGPLAAYSVRIKGHTDNVGDLAYNQSLSQRRTESVSRYLDQKGIYQKKIKQSAHAYRDPIAVNAEETGRAKNRRVEVIIDRSAQEPSLPKIDVKATVQRINPSVGGKLHYHTGTTVTIPAGALMKKDGTPVDGAVDIHYREFRDAADFITSGLPMDYDSAGKKYWFESGGMFELSAYQGEEELVVRPGRSVAVDFVKTDETDFNFYALDQRTGKWTNRDELKRETQATALPIAEVTNVEGADGMFFGVGGTITNAWNGLVSCDEKDQEWAENLAIQSAFNKAVDGLTWPGADFKKRFRSGKYAGTTLITGSLDEARENSDLYSIVLNHEKEGRRHFVSIEDLGGEHSELEAFDNIRFAVRPASRAKLNSMGDASQWADVRIAYRKNDRSYSLKLKDGRKTVRISVKPLTTEGKRGKSVQRQTQQAYRTYSRVLKDREKAFNEGLADARKEYSKYARQRQGRHQFETGCLQELTRPFMTDEEASLDTEDWEQWFTEHSKELITRYGALREAREEEINLALQKAQERFAEMRIIGGTDNYRIRSVADLNKLIDSLPEGPDRRMLESQRSSMIGHTYPNLVQSLSVDGFGVWNNDRAASLPNPILVEATYQDEQGRPINATFLSVVNYKMNCAMSNDPYRFTIAPSCPNALVVFDDQENVYVMKKAEVARQGFRPKTEHTITVQKISDNLNSSDDLRQALNL